MSTIIKLFVANKGAGSFNVLRLPLTVGLHYKLHVHKTKTAAPGAQQP